MVDLERRVCCMCGDVGFFDKLFHCSKCLNRFQHSYVLTYFFISIPHVLMCVIYSSSCIFTAYNTDLDRSRRWDLVPRALYLCSWWSFIIILNQKHAYIIYIYVCIYCQTRQEMSQQLPYIHIHDKYTWIIIINSWPWS